MVAQYFRPSINEIAPYIKSALDEGKSVKLTVTGNSMYPLFRDKRDTVTLSPSDSFKKGDVVLFTRPDGRFVLHRIIKARGDLFTFAGDNETVKEYPVKKENCLAVMKSFVRMDCEYCVDALWYRLYTSFWIFVFPVRPCAKKLLHFGTKVYKKIFRRGHL